MNEKLLAASAAYLGRSGTPATSSDLADHHIIVGPPGVSSTSWSFERDGRVQSIRIEGRVTASANDGATAAAVAGLGIVSTGLMGCRAELLNGTLIRILEGWQMGAVKVNAVFPAGRAAKLTARTFVEHLKSKLH
jgi:DNA-binding transcriptional LysR family regulator